MRTWTAERIAEAAGADLVHPPRRAAGGDDGGPGPVRAEIDSRAAGPGALFAGLRGERTDGSRFAPDALRAGAWGVLVGADGVGPSLEAARDADGAVLAAPDPLRALQRLATAWRRELACPVVGITGSTGKTSTKELTAALLRPHRRTHASPANHNTEIGLPLAVLAAPADTEALVLELAMRGAGQIAELTAIAEPDVGVIVNVGPVHLELLGSLEAIAATKAELVRDLRPGATAVVPADEPLLAPHLRDDLELVRFGPGGDTTLVEADGERVVVDDRGTRVELELPLTAEHQRLNALAAVAAVRAVGVAPGGRVEVALGDLRGARLELGGGVVVVNDCYNANPMSMRAALDDLARTADGRRVAVLGDMLELGPEEERFHAEIGAHARERGVEALVTVGPRAAAMAGPFGGEVHPAEDAEAAARLARDVVRDGDTVLVKASRGVGLEVVAEALAAARGGGDGGGDGRGR